MLKSKMYTEIPSINIVSIEAHAVLAVQTVNRFVTRDSELDCGMKCFAGCSGGTRGRF